MRLYEPPGEDELIAEYLRQPRGPHSPELQAFVKGLLADGRAGDMVVVTLVPFQLWALATLPADRSQRIDIERDRLFEDEDEASRALFLRRLSARGNQNTKQ